MSRRAVIYCRISSNPEHDEAGVQRQEAECRKLAQHLGWAVVAVYVDNDISAHSGKRRPGYQRLKADLEQGRADAVIAWHPFRLHRRPAELESFIQLVEQRQIAIRTVLSGELDLSTAGGRAMARTMAAWGAHEVENNKDNLRAQKADAAAAGKYRGGSKPFGYDRDGVTIIEAEAEEIRKATKRILAGGSARSVMLDWIARGVPTSRNGTWSMSGVKYVLRRARNAGLVERHGEIVGPAEWPAIVPEHEWRAVRAILDDPSRNSGGSRDRRWLGSGLFLCGRCDDGTTVRMGGNGAGASRGRAYRCDVCGLSRQAEPIDAYVKDTFVGLEDRDDVPGLLASFRLRIHNVSSEAVAALEAEALDCQTALDELRMALGKREITIRDFRVASAQLQADLDKAQTKLKATAARSPLSGVADAEDIRAAWDAATVEQRKLIIDEVAAVTLLPGRPGRQPGGLGYFNPDSVAITPKTLK